MNLGVESFNATGSDRYAVGQRRYQPICRWWKRDAWGRGLGPKAGRRHILNY